MVGINRRGLRNLRLSDGMIVHLALHDLVLGRKQDQGASEAWQLCATSLAVCDPSQTIFAHFWIFALYSSCFSLVNSLPLYYLHLFSSLSSSEKPFSFFQFLSLLHFQPFSFYWTFLWSYPATGHANWTQIYIWLYASPTLKTKTDKPGQDKERKKKKTPLVLNPHLPLSTQPSLWALSQMSWKSSPRRLPPPPFSLAPYSILIRSVLKCSSWEVLFHSHPKFLTSFIQHSWPLPPYTLCFLFWIITFLVFLLPFWPFHLTLPTGI